jgi:hypothetical protein
VPPPSHLTSCTPTKSNLYFESSFYTVTSEPALSKLLTLHVPSLMSLFHQLCCLSKEFVQVGVSYLCFVTVFFYDEGLLASRPTPQLEDYPLSIVRGCLFNVFTATLHSWRQSLYLQPDDVPCCGDRDSTNMGFHCLVHICM